MSVARLVPAAIAAVFISATSVAAQFTFTDAIIDSTTQGLGSLKIVDIDGDEIPDLIGACADGDEVLWWRNDGQDPPGWTRHVIDGAFDLAISVSHGDLDGDGDPDVLSAAWFDSEIAWWRNDGGAGAWPKQVLNNPFMNNAHDVHAHDLNQDGHVDILAAASGASKIAWWESDGGAVPSFTRRTIATGFGAAKSVRVADINGDGDLDVLGSALGSDEIAWWESDGADPIAWTHHIIDTELDGAENAEPYDLDGDGDVDVLAAAWLAHEFAWYRNDGAGASWTKIPVGTGANAVSIAAGHLDGDGVPDLVGAAQTPGHVSTFRSDAGLTTWTQDLLDDELLRAWPVAVGDLDGDGDDDVVSSSGEASNYLVKWYRNDTIAVDAPVVPAGNRGVRLSVSPNPSRDAISLAFEISRGGPVELDLYDVQGRHVAELVRGVRDAGRHQVSLGGLGLSGGVYLASLVTEGGRVSSKVTLAR